MEQYMQKNGLPRGDFSTDDMLAIKEDVEALEPGSVVVEVGVRFGCSLTAIALMAKEGVELHGIDIEDFKGRVEYWKRIGLDKITTFHHGNSIDVAGSWDKKIDFLHIDGNHFYEHVKADIEAWFLHMKKGRVMVFHDFDESSPGVMHAVTEFADTRGKEVKQFLQMRKLVQGSSIAKIYT